MREAGARTLGQDEATCVVYGMPRAAFELGAVERQLPLEKLGHAIRNLTNKETER
jgi:two-component system chemotaxis response regulator CheB